MVRRDTAMVIVVTEAASANVAGQMSSRVAQRSSSTLHCSWFGVSKASK